MKHIKQILEAINKGILLALDDIEDQNNDIQQLSSGKIKNNYSTKYYFIYKKYLPSIIRMQDKAFYECITYEDYFKFVNAVNKLNKKVKLSMSGLIGDFQFKKIVQHIIFGLVDKYPHINLNWIDTSCVKDMSYLLANFPGNVDVSEWNVSNVTNMSGVFAGSNFNGDLSKWNVSNVTNMMATFENSKFNNDSIKNWNVSNVTDMNLMFMESEFNLDIKDWNWNIDEKCSVSAMFSRSKMELKNIPNWLKKKIKKQTVNGLK